MQQTSHNHQRNASAHLTYSNKQKKANADISHTSVFLSLAYVMLSKHMHEHRCWRVCLQGFWRITGTSNHYYDDWRYACEFFRYEAPAKGLWRAQRAKASRREAIKCCSVRIIVDAKRQMLHLLASPYTWGRSAYAANYPNNLHSLWVKICRVFACFCAIL